MPERPLNSAGRVANYFVDSKLTPVFIAFCLVVGAIAAALTPREENPQIIVPGAEITYRIPGRAAADVEQLVVAPMEGVLREIEDVDHTFAVAAHGLGQISVQFEVGVDKDDAMVRVYQRVMSHQHLLPPDAELPLVRRVDVDDVPIVNITLASEIYDDYALRRLAERMRERLSTIEEVSVTELHGGRSRELRIELDPARLEAFGLTMNQGIAMLEASNVAAVVGNTVRRGDNLLVNLRGEITSVDAVRRLALGAHDGQLIYVDDVAEVIDGPPAERDSLARFSYGAGAPERAEARGEVPAVTLSVAKKINKNAVFVADDVLAGRYDQALEKLRWALTTGVSPVLVTGTLASSMRQLGRFLDARGDRRPEAALAKELGVPPWKMKDLAAQSRAWDPTAVAAAIRAIAVADADVKGASGDAEFALEQLLGQLVTLRRSAR